MKMKMSNHLTDFDFDTDGIFIHKSNYNLTSEEGIQQLDNDSNDSHKIIKALKLDYDIHSRHYSTVFDGDRIVDMVEVTWKFWRDDE